MDKISIIVPIYNVEKYLRDCIESIINQTYTNIEIILVNDGSTDSSLDICKEYAEKNDKIKIVNKKNGGLSDARNAGLEHATGKYIMFVGSDDYLALNSCEVLYNAIKDSDFEFITANFAFTDSDGIPWKKPMFSDKFQNTPLDIEDYKKSFYLVNSTVWNKIFKKEFLDNNHLKFEVGLLAEDAVFTTLAFLKTKKTYYIKDIVYYYRQRGTKKGSTAISSNCSLDYFTKVNLAYKIVYENFKKYNEMNFYRYYYAKSTSYILYKFIDTALLSDEEKVEVLKNMKWFFELKSTLDAPITSKSIDIITNAIIDEQYEEVIKYCKILAEAREYMTAEKRERMSRPDYTKYNKSKIRGENMYLIVGLGNPEKEYANTRHNMGFNVIDILSKKLNIKLDKLKFKALYGQGKLNDEKVLLVKPQTYMNLSGEAIIAIKNFYKISNENTVVIYDDIDLPIGEIRIKKHGSSGTHNGMKSVIQNLGTEEFPRIRIGIGKPEEKENLINYVIKKMPKEEKEKLDKSIETASEGTIKIIEKGIDIAMNEFNGRNI